MKIYRISKQQAFHGSTVKIDAFSLDYVGKGNDVFGPGIYFTSDESDAAYYGGNVHKVTLNFKKWLKEKGKINWDEVKQMILWKCAVNSINELENITEEQFYESKLSDWAETPVKAFNNAFNSMIQSSTGQLDAFLNVWINFYRQEEKEYIENMVKLGYDGVVLLNKNNNKNNTGVNHYIVYNVNAITLNGVE